MPLFIDAGGCPNSCRHCGRSGRPPCAAYYSLAELRELARTWGTLHIDAEPSAHPEFPDILGPEVVSCEGVLATNGFGIARAADPAGLFAKLSGFGYWALSLTFHGLEPRHDWFVRRRGAYVDLLTAAARALQAGFRLHWNIHLDRLNLEDVPSLIDLQERQFGGSRWVGLPTHVVNRRMWQYESLRPSAGEVAARLPNLPELAPQQWPRPPAEYTEARWLQLWKARPEACRLPSPETPASWPPTEAFEDLWISVTRGRSVYLDPHCAPRMRLGTLDEGRPAIEARLRSLSPPGGEVDPGMAEPYLGASDLLHPSAASVRCKAIAAVRYWGKAAGRARGHARSTEAGGEVTIEYAAGPAEAERQWATMDNVRLSPLGDD